MVYVFGPFELDADRFELRNGARTVPVEPKVLSLLLLLVEERARAVDKHSIFTKLWPDAVVSEASLSRAVMEARKAIGDDAHRMIVTVRGRGFRFAAEVEERIGSRNAAPAPQSPGLIGRATALMALRARLESAAAGRGSTTWVTGEAGIGKTTLVEELAQAARATGSTVLLAHCHDDPASPPYWPWRQIARAWSEARGGAEGPEGMQWLLDSETATSRDVPPAPFAAFSAFLRALRDSPSSGPVVVVIEDAQWADEASIAMLRFVAREVAIARILLLVTYRDVPPIGGERGASLAEAVHAAGAVSIALRPFDRREVAAFVERATGASPGADIVTWFCDRSGGNPLYLRELTGAGALERFEASRGAASSNSVFLTEGLRRSVERHTAAVGPACRETLVRAALLGESFDLTLVAKVTGSPPDVVLDHLTEATRSRLVEKSRTGAYRFRHGLVRGVLARAVDGKDRARIHARIAELLDTHWAGAGDAHAAELSYHYVKALPHGNAERAHELASRAAEQAVTRGAYERAVAHYEQAAETLRYLPGEPRRLVELHLAIARTLEKAAHRGRARDAYLDAAVLASALRDAELLAEAALGFAGSESSSAARAELLEKARGALLEAPGARATELRRAVDRALTSSS